MSKQNKDEISNPADNPFSITQSEIRDLSAQKVAEFILGNDAEKLNNAINKEIEFRVKDKFDNHANRLIEDFLNKEMEKIVSQRVIPVDIWGTQVGKPTTLRDALAERAKEFWSTKVDEDGKPTTWGGIPRSERLMRKIMAEEFANAIKTNVHVIVAEFKKALQTDAIKIVTEHIDKLIK